MSPRTNDLLWAVFFGTWGIALAVFATHWFTLIAAGAAGLTMGYLLLRITTTPKENHEYHHPRNDRRRHR